MQDEPGLPHSEQATSCPPGSCRLSTRSAPNPGTKRQCKATWAYVAEAFQAVTTPLRTRHWACVLYWAAPGPSPVLAAPTFSTATPEHRHQGRTPHLGTQGPEGTRSTVARNKVARGMVEQSTHTGAGSSKQPGTSRFIHTGSDEPGKRRGHQDRDQSLLFGPTQKEMASRQKGQMQALGGKFLWKNTGMGLQPHSCDAGSCLSAQQQLQTARALPRAGEVAHGCPEQRGRACRQRTAGLGTGVRQSVGT